MSTTMITLAARPTVTIDPITGVIVAKPVDGASVYANAAAVSAGGAADSAAAADVSAQAADADATVAAAAAAELSGATATIIALDNRLDAVEIGQSAAVVGYDTQANLYADLAHADKTVAYVTNDTTASKNGTYRKSGASGSGSWVQSSYDRVALVETQVAKDKVLTDIYTIPLGTNLVTYHSVATVNGQFITASGATGNNASSDRTDYVPLRPEHTTIGYRGNNNIYSSYYTAFYDANKVFISSRRASGNVTSETGIAVPTGAAFVRTCGTTGTALQIIAEQVVDLLADSVNTIDSLVVDNADIITRLDYTDDLLGDKTMLNSEAFAITDNIGRSVLSINSSGLTSLQGIQPAADGTALVLHDVAGAAETYMTAHPDYVFSIADTSGRIAFGVNTAGITTMTAPTTVSPITPVSGDMGAEINMFPCYGQSWSVGVGTGIFLEWVVNGETVNAQRYDNLSFNGGIRAQSLYPDIPSAGYTSFIPLVERYDTSTPGFPVTVAGVTPVMGQTDMVKKLLEAENNISFVNQRCQLLGTCPGEGSLGIDALADTAGIYYVRFMEQVQAAYDIAVSLGRTFAVPAFSWVQFSVDAAYASKLETLRLNLDTDIKAITGQAETVKCITWQSFPTGNNYAGTVYSQFVDAAKTYPHIYCAGAAYHLDHYEVNPEINLHFSAESNYWLGAYFGLVYKRVLMDGVDWQPLDTSSITKSGSTLYLKFNVPYLPLVFDITKVAEIENYGFNLYTSGGVEIPIVSVDIVKMDTVRIVSSAPISATDCVSYANKSTVVNNYGPITGYRGNLRDSQGTFIQADYNNLPMHNWCVAFYKTIG